MLAKFIIKFKQNNSMYFKLNRKFTHSVLSCLFFLCFSSSAFALTNIDGVRVWPAPENSRVVFDLSKQPQYSYFTLASPQRLVIDFKNSENHVDLAKLAENDPRIKVIRTSRSKQARTTRIVLDLTRKFDISIFALKPAGQYGHRLVVDLYDKTHKITVEKRIPNSKRDIVIAIDAGHGGDDPG
jgi:N-acetylmuramoyl-L-alanine amidase